MAEHDPGDDLSLEELDDVSGGGDGSEQQLGDNTNCTEGCNTNCAAACSSSP